MIGTNSAGLPLTVNGDGLLQDVHRSGFYSIRYGFGVPFQGTLTTIIDTDYEDYAVVYSCTNSLLSGVFHSEYIWVLSRSGKISNPTRQNIYEKLDKLGINRSGLTMSDRSTCPTNSSTVARESDKDLAAQGGQVVLSGSIPSSPAAGAAISGEPFSGQSASAPAANLEKGNPEQPSQKSVVVPLLYDLPSPVSSSSVGGPKAGAGKQSPPAPVDNKVPQLPLTSSLPSKPIVAAAAPPAQISAKPSASPGQPIVAQSPPSPVAQSQAPAQPQQQSAGPQQSAINPKSANQQPQQQSLMAKIQQKP